MEDVMEGYEGVGRRIEDLLRAKGYWNPARGKPDVLRFSLEHRYIPQFVYKWLSDGVVPSRANLERLAKDLDSSAPWILFGDEIYKAARRGARKLSCLVAALAFALGATGMVPGLGGPLPAAAALGTSTSYRQCQALRSSVSPARDRLVEGRGRGSSATRCRARRDGCGRPPRGARSAPP